MKLVQVYLPRYSNQGRRFPAAVYVRERDRLVERFGGITAHMRSPAHGLWKDGSQTKRDEIVIFDVMVRRLNKKWWSDYRCRLQKRFRQKELLVLVQDVKIL